MTKKTRTIIVIVIALAGVTVSAVVFGKLISGWGEQWDDDPWKKK